MTDQADEKQPDDAGYAAPAPAEGAAPASPQAAASPPPAVLPASERPWYLRPKTTIWLGPALIALCVLMRFAWGGLEGPPFPFWGIAYAVGAAGIYLTYLGWMERKSG